MYAYSLFFIMLIYGLFSVVILINVIGSVVKTLCLMLERMHFRNAYGLSVQRMLAEYRGQTAGCSPGPTCSGKGG